MKPDREDKTQEELGQQIDIDIEKLGKKISEKLEGATKRGIIFYAKKDGVRGRLTDKGFVPDIDQSNKK